MQFFIHKIKDLFEYDKNLSQRENISVLSKKILISELKKQGYDFDFEIEKDSKGKPFFVNRKDIFFSISHTREYIAICFDNKPIGIDMETIREKKIPLAERFFNTKEVDYLKSIKNRESNEFSFTSFEDTDLAFTQLWTIKEAYVKMIGQGIANNFKNIDLSPKDFLLNQNYIKNQIKIKSIFFTDKSLFLSICTI